MLKPKVYVCIELERGRWMEGMLQGQVFKQSHCFLYFTSEKGQIDLRMNKANCKFKNQLMLGPDINYYNQQGNLISQKHEFINRWRSWKIAQSIQPTDTSPNLLRDSMLQFYKVHILN